MGGLFGGGSKDGAASPSVTSVSPTTSSPTAITPVALGPYPDDGAMRMPVANSPNSIAAARKKRDAITARSGRTSTRLVKDAGTTPYANSFLGSVG